MNFAKFSEQFFYRTLVNGWKLLLSTCTGREVVAFEKLKLTFSSYSIQEEPGKTMFHFHTKSITFLGGTTMGHPREMD